MNTDINLQIEGFKESLVNLIEQSKLPASIVFYVLDNIYRNIEEQYQMILRESYNKQMQALAEQQAKEENAVMEDLDKEETIKE